MLLANGMNGLALEGQCCVPQCPVFSRHITTTMLKPGPLDQQAAALIGRWNVEGLQLAIPGRDEVVVRWTEDFEWIEGGFFILHRVQGHIGAAEFSCTEVIANEQIHSFYNAGRHQVWSHWFEEDRWMIQGLWREDGDRHVRCTSRFTTPDRRESIWERSTQPDTWATSWRITAERIR